MTLDTGISGNPFSEHYFDMNEFYRTARYDRFKMITDYDEVRKIAKSSLYITRGDGTTKDDSL